MIKIYFQLLRVPQWIKNIFIFVPILFAKQIFLLEYFHTVIVAFITFCFASSLVYIINDLIDVDRDKLHPVKKSRPIPAGKISKKEALFVIAVLLLIIVALCTYLNPNFILTLAGYIALNIAYSIILKHIVIIDIICIATGFMLRVLAGAFVISIYISSWLILTTLFISLFLAIMKRRSELNLKESENSTSTRKVLTEYSVSFTEQMAAISAAGVIICYALYTVSERTVKNLQSEGLVFTTIFVVFGIFRFMYLVYMKSRGENTTEIMLTDIPLILNIILYVFTVALIIYH
jgi:4-hydroxybenzoate polyprenyltransferase